MDKYLSRDLQDRLTKIENLISNSRFHLENKDYIVISRNFKLIKDIIDEKVDISTICFQQQVENKEKNEYRKFCSSRY